MRETEKMYLRNLIYSLPLFPLWNAYNQWNSSKGCFTNPLAKKVGERTLYTDVKKKLYYLWSITLKY